MLVPKHDLIEAYGCKCMLCRKEFEPEELERHHIIPRYEYKRRGETVDDTIGNIALLCKECHRKIHRYDCRNEEYIIYTIQILESKIGN